MGPVASNVMFAGRLSDGAVVSCTVMLKLPLAVFPESSAPEQLTDVVPSANVMPEAGEQLTITEPSTRSEAEAE